MHGEGSSGCVCLWAQGSCVPQYILREHQAWNLHGQHTVDFQVAALGLGLDAGPEGKVMGCPFKLKAACVSREGFLEE